MRCAALLLGFLLAIGCSGSREFDGRWQGERDVEAAPGADPYIVRTLSRIRITIDNTTFEMQDAGMPKSGTVRYGSKDGKPAAFLRVDSILDRPMSEQPKLTQDSHAKELELVKQPDGSVLYHDPQGFEPKPVVMRLQAQPAPPSDRK